jgi:hypothetical protein
MVDTNKCQRKLRFQTKTLDAGIIFLNENVINLKETVVVADRLKGKSEKDKTTFFMTRKMIDASNNGMDIIRLVPGVQVDLHQNISLEGVRIF